MVFGKKNVISVANFKTKSLQDINCWIVESYQTLNSTFAWKIQVKFNKALGKFKTQKLLPKHIMVW